MSCNPFTRNHLGTPILQLTIAILMVTSVSVCPALAAAGAQDRIDSLKNDVMTAAGGESVEVDLVKMLEKLQVTDIAIKEVGEATPTSDSPQITTSFDIDTTGVPQGQGENAMRMAMAAADSPILGDDAPAGAEAKQPIHIHVAIQDPLSHAATLNPAHHLYADSQMAMMPEMGAMAMGDAPTTSSLLMNQGSLDSACNCPPAPPTAETVPPLTYTKAVATLENAGYLLTNMSTHVYEATLLSEMLKGENGFTREQLAKAGINVDKEDLSEIRFRQRVEFYEYTHSTDGDMTLLTVAGILGPDGETPVGDPLVVVGPVEDGWLHVGLTWIAETLVWGLDEHLIISTMIIFGIIALVFFLAWLLSPAAVITEVEEDIAIIRVSSRILDPYGEYGIEAMLLPPSLKKTAWDRAGYVNVWPDAVPPTDLPIT